MCRSAVESMIREQNAHVTKYCDKLTNIEFERGEKMGIFKEYIQTKRHRQDKCNGRGGDVPRKCK